MSLLHKTKFPECGLDTIPKEHVTGSASPGTSVALFKINSGIIEAYNAGASDIVNVELGKAVGGAYSSSVRLVYWNGEGSIVFQPWSDESVNGQAVGSTLTYGAADSGGSHRHYLFLVYRNYNEQLARGESRIVAMHPGGLADLSGVSPNVQVDADTIDAGHSGAAGSLALASTAAHTFPTLVDGTIALGDVTLEAGGNSLSSEKIIGDGQVANALAGTAGRLHLLSAEGLDARAPAASHTMPIDIDGTLYHVLLTNVAP